MREQRETELCHLGKQTGNIGRAIARWPLVGGKLDKAIATQAGSAKSDRGPGAFTALVIYLFSMRRVWRFRKMLAIRRRGIAILADRYPQLEVPGPMDGLGLAGAVESGAFVRALARRERKQYAWMAGYRPDLVIRLNVDFATALARKPDHRPSSLRTKVGDVPRLSFNGATIADIDATQPLATVLEQARQAIGRVLGPERGGP